MGVSGVNLFLKLLMYALKELEEAYNEAANDGAFQKRLTGLLNEYAGRPTPLYFAPKLTEHCGGARILLKREDLAHTGAHKINNAIGQDKQRYRSGSPGGADG